MSEAHRLWNCINIKILWWSHKQTRKCWKHRLAVTEFLSTSGITWAKSKSYFIFRFNLTGHSDSCKYYFLESSNKLMVTIPDSHARMIFYSFNVLFFFFNKNICDGIYSYTISSKRKNMSYEFAVCALAT